MLLLLLALFFSVLLLKFVQAVVWVPLRIQHQFAKQNISGPGYRLITGNSSDYKRQRKEAQSKPMSSRPVDHDTLSRVVPFHDKWSRLYGPTYLYWWGPQPRLVTSDPDIIKDILMNSDGSIVKPESNPLAKLLLGDGLTELNGERWAVHRRITNQAFQMERVKVILIIVIDLCIYIIHQSL